MNRIGASFALRVGGLTLALALVFASTASAQSSAPSAGQYSITEGSFDAPLSAPDAKPQTGPVRLARFSFVEGNVTWRANSTLDWTEGSINLPLQQGAQVWVEKGGHAEIQFDDGSVLRLAGGSIATMQTLDSDEKGEYTQINLSQGLGYMRLLSKLSEYEIVTPQASVRAYGPAKVRVGTSDETEIGVSEGEARVEGPNGAVTLQEQDYVAVDGGTSRYEVRRLPGSDRWDNYNDDRDQALEQRSDNLPSNIALVAGDLDTYGTWRHDEEYGQVWSPRGVAESWQPYREGRWVWVASFGWTWCSSERWGWAPYHYGSWVHRNYGWAWCPGPSRQYWSPAVVHFTELNGDIGWCPLSPRDVRYPTNLSIGYWGGNWGLNFSIGSVGWYRPVGDYCEAGPWRGYDYRRSGRYIPYNARIGWGVCQASRDEFSHGWNYRSNRERGGWMFEHGQDRPGGWGVRPDRNSWTVTRTASRPGPHGEILGRPVFHPKRIDLPGNGRPGWNSGGHQEMPIGDRNGRPGWGTDGRKDRPADPPKGDNNGRPGWNSGGRNEVPIGDRSGRPGWGTDGRKDRPADSPNGDGNGRPGWGSGGRNDRPADPPKGEGNGRPGWGSGGRNEVPVGDRNGRPGWGSSDRQINPPRDKPADRPGWGGGNRQDRAQGDSGSGRQDRSGTSGWGRGSDSRPSGSNVGGRSSRSGRDSTPRPGRRDKRGG